MGWSPASVAASSAGGNGRPPSTSTSARTRSGRLAASTVATKPPIEWPTTTSGIPAVASITAPQSSACWAMPTGPGSWLERPRPRRSGANTGFSSAAATKGQVRDEEVIPWIASTGSPLPDQDATLRLPPETATSSGSGIGHGSLDLGGHHVGDLEWDAVSHALQHDLAPATAVAGVPLEDAAQLSFHRLRGHHLGARPAGDDAELTEGGQVEHRAVGHHLIGRAAQPGDGRAADQVTENTGVVVLPGHGVHDAAGARADVRPVLGYRRVTRVVVIADAGGQQFGNQEVLVDVRSIGARAEEGQQYLARSTLRLALLASRGARGRTRWGLGGPARVPAQSGVRGSPSGRRHRRTRTARGARSGSGWRGHERGRRGTAAERPH